MWSLMEALRSTAVALILAASCGDNTAKQGRMCGLADCSDTVRASTTARCLLEAFLDCAPGSAALVVGGVTNTYAIDSACRVQHSDGASLRSCAGLTFTPLHEGRGCPWLALSDCGPTLLLPK